MLRCIWKKLVAQGNTDKNFIIFFSICNLSICLIFGKTDGLGMGLTTGLTIGLLITFVSTVVIADFELGIFLGLIGILLGVIGGLLGAHVSQYLFIAIECVVIIIIWILGYKLSGLEN